MASEISFVIKHGPGELDLGYDFLKQVQVRLEVDDRNGHRGWERFLIDEMKWLDDGDLRLRLHHCWHDISDGRGNPLPISFSERLRGKDYFAVRQGPRWTTLFGRV